MHDIPGLDDIPWGQLKDVAGPADWVPGFIRGLYDPEASIDDCCDGLQDLAYQGARYSATAPAVPFMVDAVRDSPTLSTAQRERLLFTIWMAATGVVEQHVDWWQQRRQQDEEGPDAVAAWNAVTACHPALRELLRAPDHGVRFGILRVLASTGDASEPVMDMIRSALNSSDGRDVCDGWLAAVVLGQLPPAVDALSGPMANDSLARFGEAAAALRFAGPAALPEAVDELWRSVDQTPPFGHETGVFLELDLAESWSECMISEAPDHLRPHTSSLIVNALQSDGYTLDLYLRLNLRHVPRPLRPDALDTYARNALVRILPLLPSLPGYQLWGLQNHDLPNTPAALADWLGQEPPAAG